MKADVVDEANRVFVHARAEQTEQEVARLTRKIDALTDLEWIQLADGTMMRGLKVKQLWADIDFVVTDAEFGPGRSGGYDSDKNTATIRYDAVAGWAASDTHGLSFILLHELTHSTPEGQAEDLEQKRLYATEYPDDIDYSEYYDAIQFEETEEFANIGALRLATALGIAPDQDYDPTHGYEYNDPDDDPEPSP